ncbi:hypothetical protein ACSBLW_08770 [Thioclava sp. FR2]|uniref:hypothetical protein n=1 Tax=Thioclava sp. FR2 TaxID=3445780 RepID=UPI003EBB5261
MIFPFTRAAAFTISAGLCAFPAVAENETCPMPKQGLWSVAAGGGPGPGSFSIVVEGCGETLIATGLGDPRTGQVKTISRVAEGSYSYVSQVKGIPLALDIETPDDSTMLFSWTVMNMARPVYSANYAGLTEGPVRPAICECDIFVRQLREAVASNDYLIGLYSNPLLSSAPEELPSGKKWTSDYMEAVVDRGPEGEAGLRAARSEVAKEGLSGRAEELAQNGGAGPTDGPLVAQASTDCFTCQITPADLGNLCAGDVLEQAAMAHETVHADACKAQNAQFKAWDPFSGTPEPQKYCAASNVAPNLAAEEVRAYRAGNAFIRKWFTANCGGKL